MDKETAFAKWMREQDFTLVEAAEALGISRSRVQDLKRGQAYDKKRGEAKPDKTTRLAMAAIAKGVDPYPE